MCEQTPDLLTLMLLQFLSPIAGGLCYSYLLQAVSKRFAFDSKGSGIKKLHRLSVAYALFTKRLGEPHYRE